MSYSVSTSNEQPNEIHTPFLPSPSSLSQLILLKGTHLHFLADKQLVIVWTADLIIRFPVAWEGRYRHVCYKQDLRKPFSLRIDDKATQIKAFCTLPKILAPRIISLFLNKMTERCQHKK